MWILEWLPNWIFYAILLIGLLGYVATYLLRFIPLPVLYMYKTPIQVVSIFFIVIGVYMSGSITNNEAWEAKVRQVEAKLAEAEARGAIETVKIVEKIVVQEKIVRERGQNTVQYIEKEVVRYDNTCPIPEAFIESHNRSVGGGK
jgi:hypothetical protein